MCIVVFGATGFTGRLVTRELAALGADELILGGRSRERLDALAEKTKSEVRVADVASASDLRTLVRGARVVVSTVGPFLKFGEAVVRAALDAGAHFLDTTGEQAYVAKLVERYHGAAVEKKVAIVNAHAFEFALGISAASLLCERHPDVHSVDVFNRAGGSGASRGTQKSALGALQAEALVRKRGRLVPRGPNPRPMRVRFPGRSRSSVAVPFPGTEALFLSRAYPNVKNVSTNLVMPKAAAYAAMGLWSVRGALRPLAGIGALSWLEARIDAGAEGPDESARQSQNFTVLAQGHGRSGSPAVTIHGSDPYGITGMLAAQGAHWLRQDGPQRPGVVSSAEAFGAKRILGELAPHDVRYEMHD